MFGRKKSKQETTQDGLRIKNESFNFDRIADFFKKKDKSGYFQVISDKTCRDLDLDEMFMLADRTLSRVGQQYLYHVLRTIPNDGRRQESLEKLCSWLDQDANIRKQVAEQITRLDRPDAYYLCNLFQEKYLEKPSWFWVIRALSLTSLGLSLISIFYPQFLLLLLLLLVVNYLFHLWNKQNIYRYVNTIPQLLILNKTAKKISALPGLSDPGPELQGAIRMIERIGHRMSFFKLEARMQTEFGALAEFILETVKALFLLEPLMLFQVLKVLEQKKTALEVVYEFIGMVDVALSISALQKSLPYFVKPEFSEEAKSLNGKNIYHPLLQHFVANSIELQGKSVLLTGSNMSGKTTFIRTIGINAIFAQTLGICFAEYFQLPALRVQTAIRTSDDLVNDKSYYFEEVQTIKNILETGNSGELNLVLLDELFKGTNTVERIAAGKAVLSYLVHRNNLVLVSTHDLELTELLKDDFDLYHFTEVVEKNKIHFDFKLKAGNLKTTNAIRILEINGYPAEIAAEANSLASAFKKSRENGLWKATE